MGSLEKGKEGLTKFTDERLIQRRVAFHDPLLKQKAKTMNSLYDTDVLKDKKKSPVTADRDMFRRLLIAKDAGRDVNIDCLLESELSEKPLSLTTSDGRLRKANKSQLIEILAHDVIQKDLLVTPDLNTCTIIDGMALVQALGKPAGLRTFGELADSFIDTVKSHGNLSDRIDVLFDWYEERSIKEGTRVIRSGGVKTVRMIISNRDVKLPDNWKSVIGLDANKANLASFLSEELRKDGCFDRKQVIVSGGFQDSGKVASNVSCDLSPLSANHEEADTRIVLHAADATRRGYERMIVCCKDTDVLLLLCVFCNYLRKEMWMKAGTKKRPKMIRIHDIRLDEDIRQGLLAFHALTGCDTTSQFAGITKKSAWKVFVTAPHLMHTLGRDKTPGPRYLLQWKHLCANYMMGHQRHQPQSSMYAAHSFANAKRTWTFCHRLRMHLCNICKGPTTRR